MRGGRAPCRGPVASGEHPVDPTGFPTPEPHLDEGADRSPNHVAQEPVALERDPELPARLAAFDVPPWRTPREITGLSASPECRCSSSSASSRPSRPKYLCSR